MNDMNEMLEFQQIKEMLKAYAMTEKARERLEALKPYLDQTRAEAAVRETTEGRRVLDAFGNPPFSETEGIRKTIQEAQAGILLNPDQLEEIRQFAVMSIRLVRYLQRCRELAPGLAGFAAGLQDLSHLQDEIERCIRGGRVDDYASKTLRSIRQRKNQAEEQIRAKLDSMLRSSKSYFSESFVSNRSGHYTLPVKKEYKNKFPGTVVDVSSTGATFFIEPAAVSKLREEINHLETEEENEVKIILYTLSALVEDNREAITINLEYMEELDYVFAKGKLSAGMEAREPALNTRRYIKIRNGKHPLLKSESTVPLNIEFGGDTKGVIITGPNTGGKTVALKTIGLLSVMACCGLHIPCEDANLAMNADVFCDIGDGQSIAENLSTFSSHIKNIIRILEKADEESLILLDELGSGTDPAEGMGIAVAVLEELRRKGCLFVVTTHYPEVKEYGERAEGVINARMAFDKESLKPLYRLELGEAGESCAFYIARRLGMSEETLQMAWKAAYGNGGQEKKTLPDITEDKEETQKERKQNPKNKKISRIRSKEEEQKAGKHKQEDIKSRFQIGDSVMVYPQRKLGIVFAPADDRGDVGVQIQKRKLLVNYKRLQLKVAASQMYPEDYDFSIIFDTVENRKARHQMERKYVPDMEIKYEKEADEK